MTYSCALDLSSRKFIDYYCRHDQNTEKTDRKNITSKLVQSILFRASRLIINKILKQKKFSKFLNYIILICLDFVTKEKQ